jgi:hypothetical protein
MQECCGICNCELHRDGCYAKNSPHGRAHATRHHHVAERFFGRSKNRKNKTTRDAIFSSCPWSHEKKTIVLCYDCHEHLIHNPALLDKDIEKFKKLVESRGLPEKSKPENKCKLKGRILLFHEVISAGLQVLEDKEKMGSST